MEITTFRKDRLRTWCFACEAAGFPVSSQWISMPWTWKQVSEWAEKSHRRSIVTPFRFQLTTTAKSSSSTSVSSMLRTSPPSPDCPVRHHQSRRVLISSTGSLGSSYMTSTFPQQTTLLPLLRLLACDRLQRWMQTEGPLVEATPKPSVNIVHTRWPHSGCRRADMYSVMIVSEQAGSAYSIAG